MALRVLKANTNGLKYAIIPTMKMRLSLIVAMVAASAAAASYKNPVLTLDLPNLDVCTGPDGTFYLTSASFGAQPGLPILASDDLVNWRYAGSALKRLPWETEEPEHGNGVWSPSLRCRNGIFTIYWGDPDRGVYRVTAPDVAGPWSEPVLVKEGKGIVDVSVLFDDDGKTYLVHSWAATTPQPAGILCVCRMNDEGTACVEEDTLVYDGVDAAERPKFYKRDGEYWLLFAAGGKLVALRASTPYGPYAEKSILAQGTSKIAGPYQGAWVHTSAGEDWFMHISDRNAYGRIAFLEPMVWRTDGWPVVGEDPDGDGCGTPVDEHEMPRRADGAEAKSQLTSPQTDDAFDTNTLGPQWQWLGRSAAQTGYPTTRGFYRLYTTPMTAYLKKSQTILSAGVGYECSLWETPNLLVQKFPAISFSAVTKVRIGGRQDTEECGIIVQGRSYMRLGLKLNGDQFDVVLAECRDADKGKSESASVLTSVKAETSGTGSRQIKFKDVWLRVSVEPGEKASASDAVCTFSYSFNGTSWTQAPRTFSASPGAGIGAMLGIYAVSSPECRDRGWIDVDWFRIERR